MGLVIRTIPQRIPDPTISTMIFNPRSTFISFFSYKKTIVLDLSVSCVNAVLSVVFLYVFLPYI